MNKGRQQLVASRRWVVKIGSALLTQDGQGLNQPAIAGWVKQLASLCARGYEVILVSSGSIAAGMLRLGWERRPAALHELQAAAAIGQMGLVQAYESSFQQHGLHTAQVLVTHDDLVDRQRYLNARTTLRTLLSLGVVPVVNENDTVATEQIRFGDNDTLAGLIANLIEAHALIVLTDQQGLYTADPRAQADAELITDGRAGDPALATMAGPGGAWGRGGMTTKLEAAALAARSGTLTVIASGTEPDCLLQIANGDAIGTLLIPGQQPLAARKRWLAGSLPSKGELTLDAGAVRVLKTEGRSLLAVGVTAVSGAFGRGELVLCRDARGAEVARGLVNYAADDVARIKGLSSEQIVNQLGYVYEPELIHRDNLVVV